MIEVLDLTGIACPVNSARALIKLAEMPYNSILEIIIDDGEPIENVPASLEDEGYEIITKAQRGQQWVLQVKKLP